MAVGAQGFGDVAALLLAAAAVAVCAWVCVESVRRVRCHRFDYPPVLLSADEQRHVYTLRRGFLNRRRTLLETAEARVLAEADPAGAARVVAELDRDLKRLDAEWDRQREELRAEYGDRKQRAARLRSTALRLDAGFAVAGVLLAGAAGVGAVLVVLG
mgnify:FL=1